MRKIRKWTDDKLKQEAVKYTSRSDFQKFSNVAYQTAKKRGLLDILCEHMIPLHKTWTLEDLKLEAKKYNCRSEFDKGSPYAYRAILKLGIDKEIFKHMEIFWEPKWDENSIKTEALKYSTIVDFQKKSYTAYQAAQVRGLLNTVCRHMSRKYKTWNVKTIKIESLKYNKRSDFEKNSTAYQAACKRNLLDIVCSHMDKSSNVSISEQGLFDYIKTIFPKVQKLVDNKVSIPNKPHIKGFHIDIYIPDLRKGIEFDGKYWHSVEGLKRSREHWPKEDLENYHQIKDNYFKSKDIELLHINEKDWIDNPEKEINKCINFLNQIGE